MFKILSSYPEGHIAQMLDILARAGKPAGISRSELEARRPELERELLSLLEATGRAHDGSEGAEVWQEAVNSIPTHALLKTWYEAMAEAPNPLDPTICHGDLWPGMDGQLSLRWGPRWKRERRNDKPSLRRISWDDLSEDERGEIREIARHLATFHGSLAGRRRKNDLDTILLGLGEIYLNFTSSTEHWSEIRFAEHSRFIGFVMLALRPAAQHFEVTAGALTQRWRRLVRDEQASQPEDDAYRDVF